MLQASEVMAILPAFNECIDSSAQPHSAKQHQASGIPARLNIVQQVKTSNAAAVRYAGRKVLVLEITKCLNLVGVSDHKKSNVP